MNKIYHFIDKMIYFIHYKRDMNKRNQKRMDDLANLGVFTAKEARDSLFISQPTLYRLTQEGIIQKVARGLFIHPSANINYEHLDYVIACKIYGNEAVIGGLSALSYYNLVEQVPLNIWILTSPTKTKSSSQKKYRLIRTKLSLKIEVKQKNQFKIVSLERSLVEGLKHESKIGEGIVFRAIRTALQDQLTTEAKLAKTARKLKIINVLEKKWELILA